MNSDAIVQRIITDPLFLKLKKVVENNAYHDYEVVYDHLTKTHRIASEQIDGNFITNDKAKKNFLDFVNEEFGEVKMKDLMLITALVHDIGKILYYKDGEKEYSLKHEDKNGIVKMPGHEYYGSTIIPELLKDKSLSDEAIKRIQNVVRLHDTFNEGYFNNVKDWDIERIVDDIKARAEGLYKECLFNILSDCFTAKPFEIGKEKIIKIFNSPSLYSNREYFIK